MDGGDAVFAADKAIKYSFTVTYPKKSKDVCVGIGFVNKADVPESFTDNVNNQYWNGKVSYAKTDFYKQGKSTMSYMRLNK